MNGAKEVKIKLSKRKVMTLIVFIVVLIMINFTFKLIKTINKDRNISNLGNMGLVVEDGKTIYYNKWEEGIVKVKGNKETLLTEETAYSIHIEDDILYYLTVSEDQEILLKSIKTNGDDLKKVKRLYTSISKFYLQDGYIYYATNKNQEGIAKYSLETGEETIITTSPIRDFAVYKDNVYFTDDIENLYVMTTTGIELKRIIASPMVNNFQIQGKYIYFYNTMDEKFCRVDLNGENLEDVSTRIFANTSYNVTSKNIYFFDKETNAISVMDLDGTDVKEIRKINAKKTKINIAGEDLYYLDSSLDPKQAYQMFRMKSNGNNSKEIKY